MKKKILLVLLLVTGIVLFHMTTKAYAVTKRLAGVDRYGTAAAISQDGWPASTTKNAIIATGENFPDALCAAPLSKKLDAPILLTESSSLNKNTASELERLGIQNVYIIGGTGAVSASVEDQIKNMGIQTIRIAGIDRYETAVKIAEEVGSSQGLAIASGDVFADALSMAPIASDNGMNLLLVPKDYVPECVKSYLETNRVLHTYIMGDTDIINDDVSKQFPDVQRITGNDIYERNLGVINYFKGSYSLDNIYVATGKNFPDALAGAGIASKFNGIILLIDDIPQIGDSLFINGYKDSIENLVILGGEGALSQTTVDSFVSNNAANNLVDSGAIDGSVYNNSYLGLNLTIPTDWLTWTNIPNYYFNNGFTPLAMSKYDPNDVNTCYFAIHEFEKGNIYDSEDVNKCLKEYVNYHIATGSDSWSITTSGDIYTQKIGGIDFSAMDLKAADKISSSTTNETKYAAIVKGHLIILDIQYSNSNDLNDLKQVLNTIKIGD